MERMIDDTSCAFYGTEYCDLMNWSTCSTCPMGKLKDKDQILNSRTYMDTMFSLVPVEGVSHLAYSQTCQLCLGDNPQKREGYINMVICNKEPISEKKNILGIKSVNKVGSLLNIQVGTCKRCYQNLLKIHYLPLLGTIVGVVILLLMLLIPAVKGWSTQAGFWWTFLGILSGAIIGSLVGLGLRIMTSKKLGSITRLNIWQLPTMMKLRDLGWEPFESNRAGQMLNFSKKQMIQGMFSGEKSRGKATEK